MSTRAGRSLRGAVAAACVAMCVASPALADPTKEEVARADALFRAAQALMQAGSVTEACAKFGESYTLDPAPGALLNLAACHEKDRKVATAAREYEQLVELMAKAKTKDDRERLKFASDALARLEPQITRASYDVSALPAGYVLKVDGASLAAADLAKARPIEPGDHVVETSAPGQAAHTVTWKVAPQPGTQTFKAELPEEHPAVPGVVPPVPGAATPPGPTPPPKLEPFTTKPAAWQRPTGYALGGVGIVAIGLGAYFGIDTFKQRDARDPHCVGTFCDAEGVRLNDKAHTSATISTVAFAIGAAALGAGAFFVITSFGAKKSTTALRAAPTLGGVVLAGGF